MKIYPGLFTLIKYLTIRVISRIRYKFDSTTPLVLYNTVVLPYLNYCCIVWGENYFGKLERLLKLQKKNDSHNYWFEEKRSHFSMF